MKKLFMPLIYMAAVSVPATICGSGLLPAAAAATVTPKPGSTPKHSGSAPTHNGANPSAGAKPSGTGPSKPGTGSNATASPAGSASNKATTTSGTAASSAGSPTASGSSPNPQPATPTQPSTAPATGTASAPATGTTPEGTDNESKLQEQTKVYNAGLEALKKNDLTTAGNNFQQAVTLVPTDASAQMFLGYVLLKQERYDDALTALQAARNLGTQLDVKSRAVIDNNIGLVYWNKKMPAEAMTAYQSALQEDKTFVDAKYNLAFALLAQKRYKEAIPDFMELLKPNTKDATLYDGLGEAYENSTDADHWTKAIAAYNKALDLEPRNPFYQLRMALALINTGRKTDAVKYLREATKLDPQSAEAFLHLGDIFIQTARWGDAQEALSRYVVLRPTEPLGWYNLGVAYDFAGKFDDALRAYKEAERLKPLDPAVKNNIGRIYYKRGQLPEAIEQCQQALKIDENFNDARYNLALVLTAQATQAPGKPDPAKLNEADDQWQSLIDRAARKLGQPMDDSLRKETRSLLVAARAALAENYLKGEEYAKARDEYKRLLVLTPKNGAALSNLGLALYHTNEYEEAAKTYRDIIKQDPHNAIAYNNLGVVQEAQKDRAGALASYRQAVKIKPDYNEAKSNIDRLTAKSDTA